MSFFIYSYDVLLRILISFLLKPHFVCSIKHFFFSAISSVNEIYHIFYDFPHIFGSPWFGCFICLRFVSKIGVEECDVLLDEECWVTPFTKGIALSLQLNCPHSLLQSRANASAACSLTKWGRESLEQEERDQSI